ncbi:MAG: ROK family protein [Proteobacteria bacterium]|nr:MAG: ROK family protein [Pseudomonadota bacterium]
MAAKKKAPAKTTKPKTLRAKPRAMKSPGRAPTQVIGIDLGGTKVLAAMVSASGKVIEERKVPTELGSGWPGLRKQLIEICKELMAEHGLAKAVGIGSAGPLHAPSGTLLDPTNFGWPTAKIAIARELQKALKIPVRLENDAASAVLAEHWKGGAGNDCIVVTLGTGLGVGIMVEGKVIRGSRGLHGETGHILLRPGDRTALCNCGNYGCSEALLSGNHFGFRAAARLKMPDIKAKQVSEMARNGNLPAKALFDEYGTMLGEFIFNLTTMFYPKTVILTGSFAEANPHFLPRAEERLRQLLERRLKTLPIMPEIRISRLGNRAGCLGAAFVALNDEYFAPSPA